MEEKKEQDLRPYVTAESELYEELLNRYERVLVFAGQLQEKTNQQRLLVEKNHNLEKENDRLKQSVALSDAYIRLLEGALQALGVGPRNPGPARPGEGTDKDDPETRSGAEPETAP